MKYEVLQSIEVVPIPTVYFPYRSSFGSRSVLVRFSIDSRSVLDRFSFILRSSFVHPPFILRSGIEDRSKIDRRMNGESSEARRRCIETLMGNQGKATRTKILLFAATLLEGGTLIVINSWTLFHKLWACHVRSTLSLRSKPTFPKG